jgi:hypothetical protein
VIAISITLEGYEVTKTTLPEGADSCPNDRGGVRIWLARAVVDRLKAVRGAGESYSDVILRLAEAVY